LDFKIDKKKKKKMSSSTTATKKRAKPNVLICGTPGVGKTTTSEQVAEATGFRHVNVSALIGPKKLHSGWDDEFDCFTMDEDKVVDELEDVVSSGGNVVDFHTCDFFPERWFDLVVVLRANNTVLYDRLKDKGYKDNKVAENVECEIMQVVLDEARDAYRKEIVVELSSDDIDQLESNVDKIVQWIQSRTKSN
jgi:adenylate kinase